MLLPTRCAFIGSLKRVGINVRLTEKPSCAYLFLCRSPVNCSLLFFAEIFSDKVGWALATHALRIQRQPETRGHKCPPYREAKLCVSVSVRVAYKPRSPVFAEILSDKVGWALVAHVLRIHGQSETRGHKCPPYGKRCCVQQARQPENLDNRFSGCLVQKPPMLPIPFANTSPAFPDGAGNSQKPWRCCG